MSRFDSGRSARSSRSKAQTCWSMRSCDSIRNRRVELRIAGAIDRPWAEALRQRAQADPRIQFVGRSSHPRGFLADLDVFVLPSRSEGMSNALLEAMSSELPCIATDVGSNRSLLNPAAEPPAGLICEPTA